MAQIGAEPGPDFSDPLALLRACHGRVERFAELALTIADRLAAEQAPDEEVIRAAGRVLRYFDEAAPLHHADEEHDLLPRLRPRLPAEEAARLTPLLDALAAEHAALDEHWAILRPLLVELSAGRPVEPTAYRAAARPFRDVQLDHLTRENDRILPAAEAHLSAEDLAALGAAMAQRRGVSPGE
jgi:hemerythrin-like domain-containing protein